MSNKQEAPSSFIRMYDVANEYKIIDKVGRGTYGTVFKAKNLKNGKSYAIKKLQNNEVKLSNQGFPITALREISLLKVMDHQNIIKLKQIILSKPSARNLFRGSTFLVFEYMDHDLAGLFKNKVKFNLTEIKCIAKQLLKGVAYLHQNKILHRDIKSANILINDQGQVKLGDFGLGRKIRMEGLYTCKVVTLWYRAPELLLGYKHYDGKVDVWSLGCVIAQFIIGQVLFKKDVQYSQVERIYQICGDLKENKIPEELLRQYTYYNDMKPKKSYKKNLAQHIKKIAPDTTEDTISFLQGLLDINPFTRLTCQQALNHPFFFTKPLPCKPSSLQKMQYQCHEMFRERSMRIERFSSYQPSKSDSKNRHHKNHKKNYHGHTSKYSQEKQVKHYKQEFYEKKKQYVRESNYKDRYSRDRHHYKSKRSDRNHSKNRSKQRKSPSPKHKPRQISGKRDNYDNYSDKKEYGRNKQYRVQKQRPYHENKNQKIERYDENKHKYGKYEEKRYYRDDKQFQHGQIIEKKYKHYQKSVDYEPRKKDYRDSKDHRDKKQYSKQRNYRQSRQYRKRYDSRQKSPFYKRRQRSKSKKKSPSKNNKGSSSLEKSNYSQRDRSRQRHSRSFKPHDRDRKFYKRQ